jgi:hypothetical protein
MSAPFALNNCGIVVSHCADMDFHSPAKLRIPFAEGKQKLTFLSVRAALSDYAAVHYGFKRGFNLPVEAISNGT